MTFLVRDVQQIQHLASREATMDCQKRGRRQLSSISVNRGDARFEALTDQRPRRGIRYPVPAARNTDLTHAAV